jgi:hypothetical protein
MSEKRYLDSDHFPILSGLETKIEKVVEARWLQLERATGEMQDCQDSENGNLQEHWFFSFLTNPQSRTPESIKSILFSSTSLRELTSPTNCIPLSRS